MNDGSGADAAVEPTSLTTAELAVALYCADANADIGAGLAAGRLGLSMDLRTLRAGIAGLSATGRVFVDDATVSLAAEVSIVGMLLAAANRWVEVGSVVGGRPSVVHVSSAAAGVLLVQRKSFDVVDILAVRPEVGTDGAVLQTCAALLRTADPASVLVVNAIGFEGPSGAVQCLLSEDGYLIFRRDSCDPLSPGIVDAIARAAEPSGLGWRLMGPGGVADALGWVATVLTVGGSSVDLASPPGDGST